jgi:hypothetical protein
MSDLAGLLRASRDDHDVGGGFSGTEVSGQGLLSRGTLGESFGEAERETMQEGEREGDGEFSGFSSATDDDLWSDAGLSGSEETPFGGNSPRSVVTLGRGFSLNGEGSSSPSSPSSSSLARDMRDLERRDAANSRSGSSPQQRRSRANEKTSLLSSSPASSGGGAHDGGDGSYYDSAQVLLDEHQTRGGGRFTPGVSERPTSSSGSSTSRHGSVRNGLVLRTDMSPTYFWMKRRQLERMRQGTVTRPRTFSWWALFVSLALYLSYLAVQIFAFGRYQEDYFLEFEVMGFLTLTLIVLLPRLTWFWRVAAVETYAYVWFFFVAGLSDPKEWVRAGELAAAVLVLMILTLLAFRLHPVVLSCLHRATGTVHAFVTVANEDDTVSNRSSVGPDGVTGDLVMRVEMWKDARGGRSSSETHHSVETLPEFLRETNSCVYEGSLKNGRPHGRGTWIDPSPQGELLRGIFFDFFFDLLLI